ncbi:MAG TPA: N-acetylmuramic acid 6-phosphate etherase [Symbiobacteriaceae bacterium]|nr:N-acetylmuramic acid 6-phosphate etherase [Symbiobacteriaceae bacterium]
MSLDLSKLATEGRLAESMEIDLASTAQILQTINDQDRLVAEAVGRELPQIARAVDLIADRLKQGGHLIYIGAGTSGRLGVVDAAEVHPTYGTGSELVQGLIAGGREAVFGAKEGAEDDPELGRADVLQHVQPGDVVVGIAASGRTPYTLGALKTAKELGCATVAVTNNAGSPMAAVADVAVSPVVGEEVIMGSTRMKAGTAQKLVLNMLSTAAMIKLGKVYTNLMVDMPCTNEKLYLRAERMVMLATGADQPAARAALQRCDHHTKTAIVSLLAEVAPETARKALAAADGFVRRAIALAAAEPAQ